MTSEEKREFEAHKKRAEKELSNMYYGSGAKQNDNTLKMPPFLAKPEPAHHTNSSPKRDTPQERNQKPTPKEAEKNRSNKLNLLELLNFKNITMDNDRITILALCLLLSSENADELLLLALIYIML